MVFHHNIQGIQSRLALKRSYQKSEERLNNGAHMKYHEIAADLLPAPNIQEIESRFRNLRPRTGLGIEGLPVWYRDLIQETLVPQGYRTERCSWVQCGGKTGFRIEMDSGENHNPLYYLEGDNVDFGFQLGFLASEEVRQMSENYANSVILQMLLPKKPVDMKVGNILTDVVYLMSRKHLFNIPLRLRKELYALFLSANQNDEKIYLTDLIALNYGIDTLLTKLYRIPLFRSTKKNVEAYRDPLSCNAFVVSGRHSSDKHTFFGRDFMFATCDIFTHTAAYIVYNYQPAGKKQGDNFRPYLSVSAPGFIGSVTGMTSNHMSMAVHLAAGKNTNPANPGLNSLLLVRQALESSNTVPMLTAFLQDNIVRGVTYIYPVAQGNQAAADAGCPGKTGAIIEAGSSAERSDNFFRYLNLKLRILNLLFPRRRYLPDRARIREINHDLPYRNGQVVRWIDSTYDPRFSHDYNPRLFSLYRTPYHSGDEGNDSFYINLEKLYQCLTNEKPASKQLYVPKQCYFPPQRENDHDMLFATNHFIAPQMRLLGMSSWISILQHSQKNDVGSQWRYDELNRQLRRAIGKTPGAEKAPMTFAEARKIIDYLNPFLTDENGDYVKTGNGRYRKSENYRFYNAKHRNLHGIDLIRPSDMSVNGSISVMDLDDLKISSRWGKYSNSWYDLDFAVIRDFLEKKTHGNQ